MENPVFLLEAMTQDNGNMQRFGAGLLTFALVLFPLCAAVGIPNNNHFKSAGIPKGLR